MVDAGMAPVPNLRLGRMPQVSQAIAALSLKMGQGKKGGKPIKVGMFSLAPEYKSLDGRSSHSPGIRAVGNVLSAMHRELLTCDTFQLKNCMQGFKSGSQRRLSVQIPIRDESAKAVSLRLGLVLNDDQHTCWAWDYTLL